MEVKWVYDGYTWVALFFTGGEFHTPIMLLREYELIGALQQLQQDKVSFENLKEKADD